MIKMLVSYSPTSQFSHIMCWGESYSKTQDGTMAVRTTELSLMLDSEMFWHHKEANAPTWRYLLWRDNDSAGYWLVPVTIRVWCWTMTSEGSIDNNDSLILVTERKQLLMIVLLLRRIRVQNISLFSFCLFVCYSNDNVSFEMLWDERCPHES